MKSVIIFHSVCGNTYLMAKAFERALTKSGHEVVFRRVADADWLAKGDLAQDYADLLSAMRAVPQAVPADLLDADLILMGSPVYFGNVSAEIKAFMDATGGLWFQGKLVGKKFAAFVSAGNTEGGGDLALQALHTYAKYMGMLSMPVPVTIFPGENVNPLGIMQYSNGKPAGSLDERTMRLIDRWCQGF